jgi:hypothetical protein
VRSRNGAEDSSGARTSGEGTPVAVDVSADRRARIALVVLLAGPVVAIIHFMLVYLAAEAGCMGGGPGLRLFDPPVPEVVALVATSGAAIACLGFARWSFIRWRERMREPGEATSTGDLQAPDRGGELAFAGLLLSALSFVTVLLVGVPAIFLPAC